METMGTTTRRILLCDTTLRDGAQAPDIHFSFEERLEAAARLLHAGVDEIEAGVPASGPETIDFLRELVTRQPEGSVSLWCRALERDIDMAASIKAGIVHISIPASPVLLSSMGKTWEDLYTRLPGIISRACDCFPRVSLGIPDAFRTPVERIMKISALADRYRLYRIRIADTVGTAFPSEVYRLIAGLAAGCDTPLAFHGHNDLGLATANNLAAAESGAQWLDVTFGGFGERAGNARLEETVAVLGMSKNFTTAFDVAALKDLSAFFSRITERPVPVNAPLTGRYVLTHTSGVHVHSITRNEMSFQPYPPSYIGRKSNEFLAGDQTGRNGIRHMLAMEGVEIEPDILGSFTTFIKKKSLLLKKAYSSKELVREYGYFNRTALCS
ncbi:MAG: hypothetical protein JXB03_08865 [Spirochaetales bacterium]|nr:hypothetical protein [Spirochaetales bacterium]